MENTRTDVLDIESILKNITSFCALLAVNLLKPGKVYFLFNSSPTFGMYDRESS
jgi:hypothetical protein